MWLATYGGGVDFLDNQPEKFTCYHKEPNNDHSLSNNNVNTFCQDTRQMVWIGTDGGGITLFNPKEHSFDRYNSSPASGLKSNVILTIKQGKSGTILVGTFRGGLGELAKPSGRFSMFPVDTTGHLGTSSDMIGSLEEDNGGNWWIGTWHGGLNYFDSRKGTFTHYGPDQRDSLSLGVPSVQSMLKDSKGVLWIGAMGGGLARFDPETGRFIHYRHAESDTGSLSNDIVNYIMEDSKGRLWFGTNNGLNLLDPVKGSFKKYFQKDGLPNNVIQGILEDKKANLWIATNNGICHFNPQAITFRNYEYSDGLQGTVFNRGACLMAANGDMFFGGSRGFNVFNPDSISENRFIPPVFITDFQIFNKSVKPAADGSALVSHISVTKELTLSHDQSVFSFEFAALNYSLQEKNQYAYKMEGFDKDWNRVGTQRKATYTNLDPGHYVFRVIASNNDGVWNLEGTSISITVTPPFWATWWFRLMVVLFILSSCYAFYRYRMGIAEGRRKALEERVIELDKAVAQGKFEIASDVLHDIGNAIVGFGSYLNRIRRIGEQDKPDNLDKLARFFEGNASALTSAIGMEKSDAVIKMLKAMAEAQTNSRKEIGDSISEQQAIVQHIQEILQIQRQYISGKHSQDRKPVNFRDVITDCLSMLTSTIDKKGIIVVANIPPNLPLIKGDRTKLMHVFLSILKNCIDAIGEQSQEKNIIIGASHATGQVNIEITDTGEGFDEELAKRLFEKGFTTRTGGAGLGLYNCLDVVESHSGTVCLMSAGKLKGAIARIGFPIQPKPVSGTDLTSVFG
jgi:signal transduction histidine kinase/streptogramin lyase